MSVNAKTRSDPGTCPFCGDERSDPGGGVADHIDENGGCETDFEDRRTNLAGGLTDEWSE